MLVDGLEDRLAEAQALQVLGLLVLLALPAGAQDDVESFNGWALLYRKRCQAQGRVDPQGWRAALLAARDLATIEALLAERPVVL